MHIFYAVIRSKLHYGSAIFSLANQKKLKILDLVYTAGLRLITGALRTSPKISISAEAAESLPNFRQVQLISNFLSTTAPNSPLPFYSDALSSNHHFVRLLEKLTKRNFRLLTKYRIYLNFPTWTVKIPSTDLNSGQSSKKRYPNFYLP